MALLRRHRDEHAAAIRYQMRQKLIAIGDDYWIEDEEGHRAFRVNGKAVRVRDTFILEDPGGDEVAKIQERKLSVRDKMVIERSGRRTRPSRRRSSGIRDRFAIDVDGGEDMRAQGQLRRPRVRDRARRRHGRDGLEALVPRPRHLRGRGRPRRGRRARARDHGLHRRDGAAAGLAGRPTAHRRADDREVRARRSAARPPVPACTERAMTKHIDDPLATETDDDVRFTTDARAPEDGAEHLPSEITYDEQRYPARPTRLRPSARRRLRDRVREAVQGDASAEQRQVRQVARRGVDALGRQAARDPALRARGACGRTRSPIPNPRAALERASVWFTAYPLSFITRPGAVVPRPALADPALWQAFTRDRDRRRPHRPGQAGRRPQRLAPDAVGRRALRPHQHAGRPGVRHRGASSARLCATAAEYDGTVIDDIVPGHTGKGADFRLAEMGYADYPGIYHMVGIAPEDWHLLPDVPEGQRRRRTSTPRPRPRSSAPATSSAGCSG